MNRASFRAFFQPARRISLIAALLILLLLLPVWWASNRWYKAHLLEQARAEFIASSASYANSLALAIHQGLVSLDALRAFVEMEIAGVDRNLAEEFPAFARGIYQTGSGIRNLSIAAQGGQQIVYPPANDESLPGPDVVADSRPEVQADLQAAIARGEIIVRGPYQLRQGGLGLAARQAVFDKEGELWGLVGVVLDLPPLLAVAGLDDLPADVVIVLRDEENRLFFGDEQRLAPDPVTFLIPLAGEHWSLSGSPAGGWLALIREEFLIFRGASLAILFLIVGQFYLLIFRQASLTQEVRTRTAELQEANRELRQEIEERQKTEQALRRSQEILRDERDRVQAYLDLVEVIIVALDVSGAIVLINRKGCQLLGYSEEELLGRNWFETCLPAGTRATLQALFQQLMNGQLKDPEYHENPILTKSGQERLISWHNALLRDAQGQIIGSISAGADITESRLAAEKLQQQADQLVALGRISLDLATELDLDALLHDIVRQAIALLGGESGGLYIYDPLEDLLEWRVAIGPGLAAPGARLRRGEGVSGRAWQQEETIIINDYHNWPGKAAVYAGQTWGSVLATPVRWRGEFLGVIDIVSQAPGAFSQADADLLTFFASHAAVALYNARLFEAERQQRSVAQALAKASMAVSGSLNLDEVMDRILEQTSQVVPCDAANIMFYQDNTFRIVRWRGYERFSSEEFVSTATFPADSVPNLLQLVESGRPLLIPDTTTYPGWLRVPEQAWLRSHAAAPIRVQGRVIGVLNVDSATPGHFTAQHLQHLEAFAAQAAVAVQNARLYQDVREYAEQLEMRVVERTFELQQRVSEVEQLNQAMLNLLEDLSQANQLATENARKLQSANAELEAFAYSVSHDLRAPLRAIAGFSAILQRCHAGRLDEEGRRYLGNIVKASEQMGTLIDDLLAYARLGRRAVRRQPVPLSDLFEQILEALRPKVEEAAAEIALPAELPVVLGDATLLGQIFGNLLDNALLYRRLDAACRVQVEAHPEDGQWVISVADNGIGIAEEHHDKVFKMFQRLHGDDLYQGTGIGLAIVKKAVDLLEGDIRVESTEGQGSTFFVRLPAP